MQLKQVIRNYQSDFVLLGRIPLVENIFAMNFRGRATLGDRYIIFIFIFVLMTT